MEVELMDHVTRVLGARRVAKMSEDEIYCWYKLFKDTDNIIKDMESFQASPKPDRKLTLAEKLELQGYTAPIGSYND